MWFVVAAMAASAVGNLFLSGVILDAAGAGRLAGMGGFAVAYLLLVCGLWRGEFHASDIVYLLLYLVVGAITVVSLWPMLGSVMRVAVPGFIAVIATMAWTTALMPRRGIFDQGVGRLCAAAGKFLVASDIAVGVSMFDPPEDSLMVWLSLFTWVTYLGGWLLFLLAVAHPNPRRNHL